MIAGWNDQDDGYRSAVTCQERLPTDVVDAPVGEADGISSKGRPAEATSIPTPAATYRGSSAKAGVQRVPGMSFAFGVTNDSKTVVGSFFDNPCGDDLARRHRHRGRGAVPA